MDGPDPEKKNRFQSTQNVHGYALQVNCWIAHGRQYSAGRYGVTSMLDLNLWTHGPCRCSSRIFFYVLTRPICPSAFSSCQFRGNPPTQSVALAWISNVHKNVRLATCSKECSFVIHRQKVSTHWLRMWSLLQKCDDDTNLLKDACRSLETMAMQIFANQGWRFSNRIAA